MKYSFYLHILPLLMIITAGSSQATVEDPIRGKTAAMIEEQKKQRAEEIKHRIFEIKDLDRSKLTKSDRRALRRELKDLKKEAKISTGVVIIIILLLALLLILVL